MTPVSRESRPPSGWGLDAPVKGIFTEDEMEMLVGWGRSNARGTGQVLKPAEKILKKRRLLEWCAAREPCETRKTVFNWSSLRCVFWELVATDLSMRDRFDTYSKPEVLPPHGGALGVS